MSHVFSTRCPEVVTCLDPVLTVNFPTNVCPGPNSVVLANGAVVDLDVLGEIVGKFCPAVACPVPTTQDLSDVDIVVDTFPLTDFQVAQPVQVDTQAATQFAAQRALQNVATANLMNGLMAQVAFRNRFDLRDGPGPDQMMLGAMLNGM